MTSRTFTKDQRDQARADLRKMLKPGSQVQVIQRHVSRSGMLRHLSLFVTTKGTLVDITAKAAAAMGERIYDDGYQTLHVGGCGMDMHFATVYNLSRALYPDGHKCTGSDGREGKGTRCPSNDHSNDYGTAQRAFFDDLEERGVERIYHAPRDTPERDAYLAQHEEMRAYVENRLASDLGYRKTRKHSDGGYALTHRTI